MTAEELRKLAEIAGLKLSSVGELLQSGSRYYHGNIKNRQIIPTYEWQPHIRIEQAMMVAEEFTKETCLNFVLESPGNTWLANFYDISVDKYLCGQADTPALAICRAALNAAKE